MRMKKIMLVETYNLTELESTRYPSVDAYYEMTAAIISLTVERNYDGVAEKVRHAQDLCEKIKARAAEANDEKTANMSFILERYATLLGSVASFWQLCDKLDYPRAWDSLQNGLACLRVLRKFISNDSKLPVPVQELGSYLENIEEIYPCELFYSPGTLNKKEVCSICKRSPFDQSCVHIRGNLYMGEMAYTKVEKCEFLEISLVFEAANKRCVAMRLGDKENIENSQFGTLHELITNLKEPYRFFDLKVKRITRPLRTTEG